MQDAVIRLMQYYIHHNNQQVGPFTETEVRAKLAAGEIQANDNVWWDGQKDWVPLRTTALAGVATPSGTLPPMAPVADGPTSQLALWSLVCGILGFFASCFAALPAVILGHMGLNATRKNPALKGRGMAIAGLVLGYIHLAILPIISIIAISVLIALGNQVKSTFNTINAQLQEAQMTNAAGQPTAPADPDLNTNSAPATNNSDSTTNSAPANQ